MILYTHCIYKNEKLESRVARGKEHGHRTSEATRNRRADSYFCDDKMPEMLVPHYKNKPKIKITREKKTKTRKFKGKSTGST